MPDPIREWIDGMRKYQPISIAIIERLMQFVDHENSLWGDPNNPAAQARADVERILAGEPTSKA